MLGGQKKYFLPGSMKGLFLCRDRSATVDLYTAHECHSYYEQHRSEAELAENDPTRGNEARYI
jgi:hypothetical protein